MKTYTSPTLVAKGDVIALTKGPFNGVQDPSGEGQQLTPFGSVGFNL